MSRKRNTSEVAKLHPRQKLEYCATGRVFSIDVLLLADSIAAAEIARGQPCPAESSRELNRQIKLILEETISKLRSGMEILPRVKEAFAAAEFSILTKWLCSLIEGFQRIIERPYKATCRDNREPLHSMLLWKHFVKARESGDATFFQELTDFIKLSRTNLRFARYDDAYHRQLAIILNQFDGPVGIRPTQSELIWLIEQHGITTNRTQVKRDLARLGKVAARGKPGRPAGKKLLRLTKPNRSPSRIAVHNGT